MVEQPAARDGGATEADLLRRTVWLQNDLLKALAADDPVGSLVIRLGTLSRGTAVLYEATGRVVASVGRGPLRLIWEELTARHAEPLGEVRPPDPLPVTGPHRFRVGRWAAASRPLLVRGAAFHLAIASQDAALIDDLGPGLLETAEHVLGAATAVRDLTLSQERAEAARLLSALRAGVTTSRVRQTWDRLRPFRLRAGTPLRVVSASPLAARGVSLDPRRPSDALLEQAQRDGLGLVLTVLDESGDAGTDVEADADALGTPLTAVLADRPPADDWLAALARTHLTGASGPFTDVTAAPRYFEEALTAWRVAGRRHDRGSRDTLVLLDRVDFATWLLTRRDDTQVAARFDRHFGALVAAADLSETVIMYLACDQDVRRAAARLFVHPNTVRYRLAKVEGLLGAPIASASLVANLYLAFQDQILALGPGRS
jgi:purine catabolism regulator